ncbi:MAG: mechanosensitive ion channel, partial [Candidatus Competibacteraceae bacterium]|nr:mechanosensitive ion channel [Candidatus Competibacteraceae bacterium]
MCRLLMLCLVLWLVGAGYASAATAPVPFLDRNQGRQSAPEPVILPEPTELAPNWWDYFAAEGEELIRRIDEFLARLEALQAELPPRTAEAALPYIERIRSNLRSLPQARAQSEQVPPAPVTYADRYTIAQVLDLANRQRRVQGDLQAELSDVASAERTLKAASRRIDTLLAAYLDLPIHAPARVLRGLEIIAERSAVALAEQQLRVRRAAILAQENRMQQLEDELAVAAGRLSAEPEDLVRLNTEIEQARSILDEARERLVSAQARALSPVEEGPEGQANGLYRQQRAVRAAVVEAIAQLRLVRFEAQRDLSRLLLEDDSLEPGELLDRLADWQAQVDPIAAQLPAWRADSERERDRAGEAVARENQPGAGEEPLYVKLLHQDRLAVAQETLVALQRLEGELEQTRLLLRLADETLARIQGGLRDWQIRIERLLTQVREQATGWISMSLFKLGGTPVTTLGLLRLALILFIAWWVSYALRRALRQLGERRQGLNQSAIYTVGRLSHYFIVTLGFIVGLSSIGVDFTNFALVAGALSIGIGFGLQSIVNNFVSGLILLFERSLKVGDWIELASGVAGEVREINVRSTVINTNDNIDIVVPNSEFMNNNVTNWTLAEGFCRIHLPFRVAYGVDKDQVRQAVLEAAEKLPHTLTGVPGRNPG